MKSKYPHIKRTVAKGKPYYFFRTGVKKPNGREILTPLPDMADPGFWNSYASCMAGRTRRSNVEAELTVPALCALYEASDKFRRLAPGSQRLYRFGLNYFKAKLPTAPAGLLERKDVARLIDGRADQPGAANSLLRTINAVYKWARERGHVSNDPGKDIPVLDVGEHEPWPQHVLDAALAAEDDRVRLATHLLYYTAQRIGDVCRFRWGDIKKWPDGTPYIWVLPQKTKAKKKELEIPLHDALLAELAKHERGLSTIITAENGKPIKQQALRISLQKFVWERFSLHVNPHGLRKNAVNALLEVGCSGAQVGSISGQTIGIIEHYAKARAQGRLANSAMSLWNRK